MSRKGRDRIVKHDSSSERKSKYRNFLRRVKASRRSIRNAQEDEDKSKNDAALAAEIASREADAIAAALALAEEVASREDEIALLEAAKSAQAAEISSLESAKNTAESDIDALELEILNIDVDTNIKLGESALNSLTTNALYVDNIVLGRGSLSTHTRPIHTVAIGALSQENAIYDAAHDGPDPENAPYNLGNRNVSVGYGTFRDTTTGVLSTATGYGTFRNNTTGHNNTGLGAYAGVYNTTSWGNVAIGAYSNALGTTNGQNTSVGYYSLYNNVSAQNTALGYKAGFGITSGYWNTVVGSQVANTASMTGINNTVIGYIAEPSSASVSNEITLGNSSIGNIRCNTTSISSLSDSRDKAEITNIPEAGGLDFITKLRPITFYWDRREWYDDSPDGSKVNRDRDENKPNSGQKMGFIAQEVLSVVKDYKYIKDTGIVSDNNPEKLEFSPNDLITPLVKAIQQLNIQNKDLLNRILILEEGRD